MNKKTSWMILVSVLALCGLLLTAGCSKKEEQPANTMSEQPAMAPAAAPIDPATVATIDGTVKFDGLFLFLAATCRQQQAAQGKHADRYHPSGFLIHDVLLSLVVDLRICHPERSEGAWFLTARAVPANTRVPHFVRDDAVNGQLERRRG